jgi:SAM-dependent methyltransferase
MHASSSENMARCHARYLAQGPLAAREGMLVVDVGGADINGGYRDIFPAPRFRYLTLDVSAGEGVDVVMEDPYRLPFESGSVDVVVSGQMLEHCEFFWLAFAEMMRVLKPDGLLFLIAPSAGPIHRYPVDCYRFYPDAYAALARHAGCHLVECWLDERGPWRDLVGVFSHSPLEPPAHTAPVPLPSVLEVVPGSAEEEATGGALAYREVLSRLHAQLRPSLYLEIGVRQGASLALAQGPAVGVDPAPDLAAFAPPAGTRVFEMESDAFFREAAPAALAGQAPDLCFIDGMHLFEFALRDFMHVERLAGTGSLVVIDDIYPLHPAQAERHRRTRVWTGDVWKLHALLAAERPDLVLLPIDTAPTGLLLVAGLDPDNRVLWEGYNPLVRQYRAEADVPVAVLQRQGAWSPSDPRLEAWLSVLRRARDEGMPVARLRNELRSVMAE